MLLTCLHRLLLAQLRRTLRSTTGCTCRNLKFPHRPDGNIADALASSLACAVQFLCWRTCARDLKFPKAPMGKWLTYACLDSLLRSAQVSAAYVWQRPYPNYPNAPMGDSRFARCLQGGGVYVGVGTVVAISSCTISGNTATYVRTHAQ